MSARIAVAPELSLEFLVASEAGQAFPCELQILGVEFYSHEPPSQLAGDDPRRGDPGERVKDDARDRRPGGTGAGRAPLDGLPLSHPGEDARLHRASVLHPDPSIRFGRAAVVLAVLISSTRLLPVAERPAALYLALPRRLALRAAAGFARAGEEARLHEGRWEGRK